ncbi:hypothetical protein LAZ67_11001036 [Cordylochernes scorpioides]|uniref:Tc1-like transposase DDE domain-containing protein n=1 Tax=Cordylochernes scorpioides TaxID=51811 RepID=A0ABY6KY68_9ARAC|nr:hypothetical protein LAZ67_11001036 [Cordylochernes scorpioides]
MRKELFYTRCMDIKNARKWCREFNEGRINVHDEQRSGRPSLPESTVARIDEMVRANRRITLEKIEDGLNEDCSHFSVHKIVSETLGYRKVSASDESRFSLNTDSRRVFIWREPGTRYHRSNIREMDSFRGGSLLVWAGISSSRRTPLHIFSGGTLTAQRYRDEILEPYLRPYRNQIGHNLIFMDDNARPHRAGLVNEYLQSENIRRMDWPARSPDLNPIEHVWDALGRRIGDRHPSPRTLVELRTALLEEWGLLPLDLLQSLVNSMRARCETLIAVRVASRTTADGDARSNTSRLDAKKAGSSKGPFLSILRSYNIPFNFKYLFIAFIICPFTTSYSLNQPENEESSTWWPLVKSDIQRILCIREQRILNLVATDVNPTPKEACALVKKSLNMPRNYRKSWKPSSDVPKPCDKFSTFDLTSSRQCSRQQATNNFPEVTSLYKLYMERLPHQQYDHQRPSLLTELSSKLDPSHTWTVVECSPATREPRGQTVNSVFYLEVLRRLKRRIARVRTDIKDTVKLHHDNATSYTAFIITNFLARSNTSVILLSHPPYSPDLAPCDLFLFPRLKREMKGKHWETVENIQHHVTTFLRCIPFEEFQGAFQAWQTRLRKCIDAGGVYFEEY